ncbi:MAG: phosphoribosyltransferase [Betaproteobacteria bacterium RIFCSPLOWO2_12_FULL_62_13]|nr:MAG: phosphoribosyltransferase [Betaproteobacteria bacterium RIFCSPLOWO2_12_FULL_62_13]
MERIHELLALRDRSPVFRDRVHAGEVLAGMLAEFRRSDAVVLAIPAGGVPVAAEVATRLDLPLHLAVVSKILLPWTTELGYGAVAWDGTIWMNEADAREYRLTEQQITRGTAEAMQKVRRRYARLRGRHPMPALVDRTAILVDDGIAAGSTMRTAIMALRKLGAQRLAVAVPTGHEWSLRAIAALVDAVYCANVRGGLGLAVAEAYEAWTDVSEDEVAAILRRLTPPQ